MKVLRQFKVWYFLSHHTLLKNKNMKKWNSDSMNCLFKLKGINKNNLCNYNLRFCKWFKLPIKSNKFLNTFKLRLKLVSNQFFPRFILFSAKSLSTYLKIKSPKSNLSLTLQVISHVLDIKSKFRDIKYQE